MTEKLLLRSILVHGMTTINETQDLIGLLIDPLIVHHKDVTLLIDTDLVATIEIIPFQNTPFFSRRFSKKNADYSSDFFF